MKARAKKWARATVLAELRDLLDVGLAANSQEWARVGVEKMVAECRVRRREGRRLLRIAIKAVENAR